MANHSPPSFSAARRLASGFQVLVTVAAAVAVGVMVNYLAARHSLRHDLSAGRDHRLSPQTLRVLRALTNEVKVTIFFDVRSEEEVFGLTSSLLREYSFVNPRVSVKAVDPTRHPAEAELVLARHKLTGLKNKNFVIFDGAGGTKIIYANELSEYDINAVLAGQSKEFKRTAYNGEMLFTTAIFNLAHPREFKVCFLTGHGEHDPGEVENPHGYAKFAATLQEKSNVRWEKISLLGTNDLPADCHLLIVAGARLPIGELELEKINRYLKQGGRLFALMGNLAFTGGRKSGLEQLLARWGIGVAANMIIDIKNCPSPTGNTLLAATNNTEHPVMKALKSDNEDLRPLLVLPRAIGQAAASNNVVSPDAPKLTILAATGPEATEVTEIREGVPYRNPYQDKVGMFPIIVAAEQGRVRGVTTERGSMRAIIVGDSLCLDNELIDAVPANHYFAVLAVDWLLDRPQLALEGLLPRPVKEYRILMTNREATRIRWILLAGLPGVVLALGGLVWARRRQ